MSAAAPTSDGRAATARVGMAIFLGTVTMLFAALFFAYAVMRVQAPAWPPAGAAPLPRGLLGLNTLMLIGATLALHRSRPRTALVMGAAFLAAQVFVWRSLVLAGGGPASGIYGSVFFAISGFHALHVTGGLIALAAIVFGRRGGEASVRRLRLCGLYWDFVLVVWALFYLAACLS